MSRFEQTWRPYTKTNPYPVLRCSRVHDAVTAAQIFMQLWIFTVHHWRQSSHTQKELKTKHHHLSLLLFIETVMRRNSVSFSPLGHNILRSKHIITPKWVWTHFSVSAYVFCISATSVSLWTISSAFPSTPFPDVASHSGAGGMAVAKAVAAASATTKGDETSFDNIEWIFGKILVLFKSSLKHVSWLFSHAACASSWEIMYGLLLNYTVSYKIQTSQKNNTCGRALGHRDAWEILAGLHVCPHEPQTLNKSIDSKEHAGWAALSKGFP